MDTRTIHAVCSHDCPDSCGVLVTVQTDPNGTQRATRVQGDPTHPVTRGFLCGKVAKYLDRVYAPRTASSIPCAAAPGIPKAALAQGRELEAFERISWDEALDEIAQRLTRIAADHGPESILPYSYAGTIGQLGYGSMDRRFFHRLGASQLDRTICASAGGAALSSVYGVKLGTPPQDFAHAGLIFAWGANIHGNNVHLWPFIEEARRTGARLIVIDPYRTRTAALADEHLAINPGTDGLLALGFMHILFQMGLEDKPYLEACTNGHAELRAHALKPQHAPEPVSQQTGIPAATIVRLAREYGRAARAPLSGPAKPAVIRLNYGVQRSQNGGTAARAICMLPLITGSWKQRGGGLLLSTSGSFPFDNNALQMPGLMLKSPLNRPARIINMSQLGQALAPATENPPTIKALFVYNSNPAAIAPNQNAVLEGLRREDLFTVVHEQFFTDTADYADILLPAPTFLETKDIQGAYGHLFAQISNQAIEPLGEVRNNVTLFAQLAQRMGFQDPCFKDSVDDLIDSALGSSDQSLATQNPWFQGITRQRLEREGHIPLALPTNPEGLTLPFSTPEWFRTPSGKAELLPVPDFIAPEESRAAANPDYPLEFLPRKADNYMNSTFANHPTHQRMESATTGILEIHADDAHDRGIAPGDPIEVFNRRGSITLTAQLSPKVAKGVVAARLDWSKVNHDLSGQHANVNALTSERLTDLGGGATFYSTLVQVRPQNNRGAP